MVEPVATHVWFEVRSSLLYCGCDENRSLSQATTQAPNSGFHTEQSVSVEIDGIVTSTDFHLIAEEDFESSAPVVKFEIGCAGTVVICHHRDDVETWLPVDMWLPGSFTPIMNGVVLQSQAV